MWGVSLNAGSWSAVSSFIALGLNWYQSVIAITLGGFLIAIIAAFK